MNEQSNMEDNQPTSDDQSDVRKVLNMLQDRKVTVDEAEQLLGALPSNETATYGFEPTDSELRMRSTFGFR